jgi:hypothetical protein
MGFLQNLFSDTPEDTTPVTQGGAPKVQQHSNQPIDGTKQQQIVDVSFQRLVVMFISRLMMFHANKTGEQVIKERLFMNFPTVIDKKSFIESMTAKLQKEIPNSDIKLTQQGPNSWDVILVAPVNVPALVEKHMPQFASKLDTVTFNTVNGLNPIPQYLNNPGYQSIQNWIALVETTLVDNLKPIGKPFSFLSGKELTVHLPAGEVFPPQAIIPVENHFSADGLQCKVIDNRDVMEGQTITLLFTPAQHEADFNLPQLNGSRQHDDQHIIETNYVSVEG